MEIIYNFRILAYRLMTGYTIQISGHDSTPTETQNFKLNYGFKAYSILVIYKNWLDLGMTKL